MSRTDNSQTQSAGASGGGGGGGRYTVPGELRDLLLEFTISCLVEKPSDLVGYAVEYFSKLKEKRTAAASASPARRQNPAMTNSRASKENAVHADSDESMPSADEFDGGLV